jgi:hypothetical protein
MAQQQSRHEPLFDIHPLTGASIEVFYSDRGLETFGSFGGLAGRALRQTVQRVVPFPRATQRTGTR